MASLGEEFPKEQARVRGLLGQYKEIGAPGMLGAAMIERTLQDADKAASSGDVIEMLRAWEALKACE